MLLFCLIEIPDLLSIEHVPIHPLLCATGLQDLYETFFFIVDLHAVSSFLSYIHLQQKIH
jgi:hypothetical protein